MLSFKIKKENNVGVFGRISAVLETRASILDFILSKQCRQPEKKQYKSVYLKKNEVEIFLFKQHQENPNLLCQHQVSSKTNSGRPLCNVPGSVFFTRRLFGF